MDVMFVLPQMAHWVLPDFSRSFSPTENPPDDASKNHPVSLKILCENNVRFVSHISTIKPGKWYIVRTSFKKYDHRVGPGKRGLKPKPAIFLHKLSISENSDFVREIFAL